VNKLKTAVLCLALLLCLPLKARAVTYGCMVPAAAAGETVRVYVVVSQNPGFTNFGIGLHYDHEKLELTAIRTDTEGEDSSLPNTLVSTSTAYTDAGGDTLGFVTAASGEPITGDAMLFEATFAVKEGARGSAQVMPVVYRLRTCDENNAFSDAAADVRAVAPGDVNRDGCMEYDDVIAVYAAANGERTLTPIEAQIADVDGDGDLDADDALAIYSLYTGGE